mmetsp:Transcript_29061/g.59446  ORF Transcript_29061/g.59446 Transcript_29061/m.59446 type:complete len:567 (-) Transcript_29061:835-2535(-)
MAAAAVGMHGRRGGVGRKRGRPKSSPGQPRPELQGPGAVDTQDGPLLHGVLHVGLGGVAQRAADLPHFVLAPQRPRPLPPPGGAAACGVTQVGAEALVLRHEPVVVVPQHKRPGRRQAVLQARAHFCQRSGGTRFALRRAHSSLGERAEFGALFLEHRVLRRAHRKERRRLLEGVVVVPQKARVAARHEGVVHGDSGPSTATAATATVAETARQGQPNVRRLPRPASVFWFEPEGLQREVCGQKDLVGEQGHLAPVGGCKTRHGGARAGQGGQGDGVHVARAARRVLVVGPRGVGRFHLGGGRQGQFGQAHGARLRPRPPVRVPKRGRLHLVLVQPGPRLKLQQQARRAHVVVGSPPHVVMPQRADGVCRGLPRPLEEHGQLHPRDAPGGQVGTEHDVVRGGAGLVPPAQGVARVDTKQAREVEVGAAVDGAQKRFQDVDRDGSRVVLGSVCAPHAQPHFHQVVDPGPEVACNRQTRVASPHFHARAFVGGWWRVLGVLGVYRQTVGGRENFHFDELPVLLQNLRQLNAPKRLHVLFVLNSPRRPPLRVGAQVHHLPREPKRAVRA